jgi:hypothetical protein
MTQLSGEQTKSGNTVLELGDSPYFAAKRHEKDEAYRATTEGGKKHDDVHQMHMMILFAPSTGKEKLIFMKADTFFGSF